MKVINVSIVYGELPDKAKPSFLCEPILHRRFSVKIPPGKPLLAAKTAVETFVQVMAQLVQKTEFIENDELPKA